MDFWEQTEKILEVIFKILSILGILIGVIFWIYSIFEKQKLKISELEKKVIKVEAEMDLLKQILPTLNQIIEDYNKKRTEEQYQELYPLNKKINEGRATKEEQELYVRKLKEANVITQEQYNNYETQNDNTDLLKAILLVGAFALIAYLIVKNNE